MNGQEYFNHKFTLTNKFRIYDTFTGRLIFY